MVRKTKGRQKVEMVKMPNESNLQVTFSKRRAGLFKKASELATLCGAEIGLIVFSPGRKVFSFGHPCVETLIERFLSRSSGPQDPNDGTMQLIEAHRNANLRELNAELTQVMNELEAEKKRGEELARHMKASQSQCWWENPTDELDYAQLEQLKASLEELKRNVTKQADKAMSQSTTSNLNIPCLEFFRGGSSSSNPQGFMNNDSNNFIHDMSMNHFGGFNGDLMNMNMSMSMPMPFDLPFPSPPLPLRVPPPPLPHNTFNHGYNGRGYL